MRQTLKRHWLTVVRGKPGRRFQARYARARKSRLKGGWVQGVRRILLVLTALAALAIGLFLMFVPGPAILFYFIAGTLLASESLCLARLMDWAEVRGRTVWKRIRSWWEQMSSGARSAVVVAVVGLGVTLAGLLYRLLARWP